MLFMNEMEIDTLRHAAMRRDTLTPNVRAIIFLAEFRDEVNQHSDGWAYWPKPVRAARQLMELIQKNPHASDAELRKAIAPIRSFYTRYGNAAGMKFPAGIV